MNSIRALYREMQYLIVKDGPFSFLYHNIPPLRAMPLRNAGGSLEIRGILACMLQIWEGEYTAMVPSLICHGCPRVRQSQKLQLPKLTHELLVS